MEKTIKIDSKTSIKVSNNIGWMFAYRDQFGHDIVPDLIPVLKAAIDIAVEISRSTGEEGATTADVLRRLDADAMKDALLEMSGLEFVDLIHVVWAMAKAADEDIEEPKEWIRQFDTFPLDTIMPAIFDMTLACMVSTKNLKRLRTAMQGLKPSPSTVS